MIIDLCCGIGRFPGDHVVSIDSDPKTKPSILADIRHLPLRPALKPKLCHASPPCTYFSYARARSLGWHVLGVAESLELVAACFRAFNHLEAKNWTLENPVGMLGRILNQARIEYGSHYEYSKKPTHFWSNNKGLRRALIPMDVRQRLLTMCENNPHSSSSSSTG